MGRVRIAQDVISKGFKTEIMLLRRRIYTVRCGESPRCRSELDKVVAIRWSTARTPKTSKFSQLAPDETHLEERDRGAP